MQIHVARNGQQLGQYSIEEVNRRLVDGTLASTDLAWHEGAAGWAPLSSIAAVTLPGSRPIPTPPPTPASTTASDYPVRPAPSSASEVARQPVQGYKGMAVTSWIMLGFTALLSIVPVLGFAAWFLSFVVIPLVFILAIIILTRGGTTQGILILVTSVVLLPVFIVAAPLASTFILGAAVSEREKTQEKQIIENLRVLDGAKTKWIAQTRVKNGAKVTVAGLSAYLDGKEVKSIVGEIYDPMPVGQEPIAMLPATKSLASHKKGAVLTASGDSLEMDTSASSDLDSDDDDSSPVATPEVL